MITASSSRALEFREQLSQRIVVADGAMGTMLYANGVFINRCFDELSLSSPELVSGIHRDYAAAGAEILETNTFGANRVRLGGFGLADKLKAINEAGVRLAREAAHSGTPGGGAFVAGAMGPLGVRIEPLGSTSFAEARTFFREQAEVLVAAGVDLLILETFSDLHELREGVLAAREAAGPDLVIIAQVTIDDFARLSGGASPESFTQGKPEDRGKPGKPGTENRGQTERSPFTQMSAPTDPVRAPDSEYARPSVEPAHGAGLFLDL
jgi:methionine synthase / methylenetetrahydrofolate reductase(NADPH)